MLQNMQVLLCLPWRTNLWVLENMNNHFLELIQLIYLISSVGHHTWSRNWIIYTDIYVCCKALIPNSILTLNMNIAEDILHVHMISHFFLQLWLIWFYITNWVIEIMFLIGIYLSFIMMIGCLCIFALHKCRFPSVWWLVGSWTSLWTWILNSLRQLHSLSQC